MPEHVTITDPDIHEPKDIATAASGQVYVADGGGSGDWTKLTDDIIIVDTQADLEANATEVVLGGVTTLRLNSGEYLINTGFSLNKSIGFPGAAGHVTLRSRNRVTLTYTGSASLFHDTDAEGNIEVHGLTEFKAPSGNMFNLDAASGSWSFQAVGPVRFTDCVGIGTVNGGSSGNGAWNVFFGTFSDFDAGLTAIDLNFFEVNTVFVFGNNDAGGQIHFTVQGANSSGVVNFHNNTFSSGSNETIFLLNTNLQGAVDSVNISDCQVEGGINGTTFAATGLTQKDTSVYAAGNTFITSGEPDALIALVNNATTTTISAIDTPVLVAGTWVEADSTKFTTTSAGRITYDDIKPFTGPIDIVLSVDPASGTNQNIRAYVAKNGSIIANSGKTTLADSGSPEIITLIWQATLAQNDFLEVWIENKTSSNNVTVKDATIRFN